MRSRTRQIYKTCSLTKGVSPGLTRHFLGWHHIHVMNYLAGKTKAVDGSGEAELGYWRSNTPGPVRHQFSQACSATNLRNTQLWWCSQLASTSRDTQCVLSLRLHQYLKGILLFHYGFICLTMLLRVCATRTHEKGFKGWSFHVNKKYMIITKKIHPNPMVQKWIDIKHRMRFIRISHLVKSLCVYTCAARKRNPHPYFVVYSMTKLLE